MATGDERFRRAIAAIDAANADDPNTIVVDGVVRPKEQAHAELMTEWVQRLAPEASEALLLAARAHHLRRWVVPRGEYPDGRAGYLRWRRDLHDRHARDAAELLAEAGYDETTINRVQRLIGKKGLGRDPEVQVLEDALCLVFVETQFADLAAKLDRPKMVDVVRKTLKKMSPAGIEATLALDLTSDDRALIEEAARG